MNKSFEHKLCCIANDVVRSVAIQKDNGLKYGRTGMAIFLYHYARHTNDEEIEEIAFDQISYVSDNLDVFPMDYANGLCGIGVGIDYLLQQNFLDGDADEILEDIDSALSSYIHDQKIYLSMRNLFDFERYFLARLSNSHTIKKNFLRQTMEEIKALMQLHIRVRPTAINDYPEVGGISGNAGLGLTILSVIDKRHNTWIQLI